MLKYQRDVLGGGAFGVIRFRGGHDGNAPMTGVTFQEEEETRALSLASMCRHREKLAFCHQEEGH